MTITNKNRKILDLKSWQPVAPAPAATAAGAFIASSRHYRQQQLYLVNATTAYLYDPNENGWIQIPSPALGGTFGVGACGVAVAVGPTGTAQAGSSTTTINTLLTLARDLRGYSIHITAGTNKGLTTQILGNTVGANATIRVASPGVAFDNTSVFRLMTPRWYVLNAIASAGTTTANVFKYYDYATNVWVAAETGATDGVAPAAVIGTDGRLVSTPSWIDDGYLQFSSGTISSASPTTFVVSGKTWTTNQWAKWAQVRIVSGTGAGQIRRITSNVGDTCTVPAWTIQPDGTSTYSIEGDDDSIYYTGSGGTAFFRYSISGGTWSSLAARTAPGAGLSCHWVWGCTEADWTAESTIKNGRYFYSFRGAGGALLDVYDIALDTWTNGLSYAPAVETFTTGTKYAYVANSIYIHKDATGRWFRFDVALQSMTAWDTMPYPNGAAVVGDTAFDVTFHDGVDDIVFVHMVLNTQTFHMRMMVI